MASFTDISIRRPVATAMSFLIVITVGLAGLWYLPVDLLPKIEFTQMAVYVRYANVGPEEIESMITDPLENALTSLPNLERMTSNSEEGRGLVRLEFTQGTDLSEAANDIRAALDGLRGVLPEEADPPGIWKFDPNSREIVTMSVESTHSLDVLTRILEREISQRFEQIPGVGAIEVAGGIYREIQVQLLRDRLKAAGVTAGEVRNALVRENVQLPGGNVQDGVKDLYVRTMGEYVSLDEIKRTVVAQRNGNPIRVQDVAQVVDGFEDVRYLAELSGVPVVRFELQKQSGANTVTVAKLIRERMEEINNSRNDLRMTIISDQSVFIRQSMDSVQNAAFWGGLLAICVLYLFLRNKSTTSIIAMAIPISIIATFGLLYFWGLTLNQMTFGGLALGIGLMVDNAIVVLENIVRKREKENLSKPESAAQGAREVSGAIVASTLTTTVIFLPVVFMQTTSGQLFQALALVVVFALGCSLLVALTLVPMLSSRFLTVKPEAESGKDKLKFSLRMERLENWYANKLEMLFGYRKRLFAGVAFLVFGTLMLWPLIPVELAPPTDTDEIDVEIEMARGTNMAVVRQYLQELDTIVRPLLPMEDIVSVATEVRGDNAEVEISMKPYGVRKVNTSELADKLRRAVTGKLPGAQVEVQAQSGLWILRRIFSGGGGDEDVEMMLLGHDLDQARELANEIRRRVMLADGVVEVRTQQREGRPEENMRFNREKIYDLGLSVEDVARAVQTNVGGTRAGYYREGGEQFEVIVRLRPQDRLTAKDLGNISVKTPDGQAIPVSSLVTRSIGRGPVEIDHINGQRVTYITANLENGVALGTGVARIQEQLKDMQLPDNFSIIFGGAYREQQKARWDFMIAIVLALSLVYMVMAAQFERFLDPLVVMFSVPLAIVGVVPTLLLTGTTLNIQSIMGLVMLIGIVVNNAIVLVDYLNLMRREQNLDLKTAAIEAARLRLRPILMTSLTTMLGLLPLALGWGAGAGLQAALARVVIGGLFASTLITLVLIPTLYVTAHEVLERSRLAMRLRFGQQDGAVQTVESAD
jgi:HAE1 family hydrophobic/amphiphilic exporter-1